MIIYSGLLIQRFPKLKLEKKIQVQPKQLKVFMKIKAGWLMFQGEHDFTGRQTIYRPRFFFKLLPGK